MLTTKMIRLVVLTLGLIFFTACNSSSGNSKSVQDIAIDKIVSFATNGTVAPSVQDYIDAGVTGVTAENLSEINGVVAGLTAEDVDTVEEIQSLANQYGVEVTVANIPPIAKGGSPKTVVEVGETVKFSSTLSSDPDGEIVKYQWMENGRTIARVPFYWKVYNVPGTYKIKLIVTDNDGATSSNTYTVTVESTTVTFFENNTSTPLVDSGTVNIDIGAADAVSSITKVTTTIDLLHTWVGDLRISMKSPTGTTINLINRHGHPASFFGTSGDNFTNTTFDDDAATAIEDGTPPFTGTFIPEEPLANFIGENAEGTWTLSIEDNAGADTGTFNSWSITVE